MVTSPRSAEEFPVQHLTLHGERVAYRRGGEGPVLLLLHGIAGSSRTWIPAMRLLQRDYTVLAPDFLGHGESGKPLGDYSLGGEQSGHVIFSDHATTGDGVLTGLQLASRVAETGTPLSELAAVMDRLPQVLVNVRGVDKSRAAEDEAVQAAVAEAEARLGETGRVLLRPSGTEPVVRVMVEAPDEETAGREAQVLADVVQRELRLHD